MQSTLRRAQEPSMQMGWNCPDPGMQICSRCIYDERVAGITFDADGVCNLCRQVERLKEKFGTGTAAGETELHRIVEEIRSAGRGKRYDCIIGVSGGTDSSYMLCLAREWGLRPLAVHYDNTWNTAVATENIRKVLGGLDIDLETYVIDNKESDDIFRAFFLAGVPEFDASTDLALAEVMYRAAWKHGVHYVLEGHSFVTEGITPLGRNYFDGRYIESIHALYGRRKMATYPLMTFSRMLFWAAGARIRKIRPFWYLNYSKANAQAALEQRFGWTYYGGHHLENRAASFLHAVYLPGKFDTDMRNNTLAAKARNGELSRAEAWAEYQSPPQVEEDLVPYLRKRLDLSEEEYRQVMESPPRSWWEFPTYKKKFERYRPLFSCLAKRNLVPTSFYLKYCFPAETGE